MTKFSEEPPIIIILYGAHAVKNDDGTDIPIYTHGVLKFNKY